MTIDTNYKIITDLIFRIKKNKNKNINLKKKYFFYNEK